MYEGKNLMSLDIFILGTEWGDLHKLSPLCKGVFYDLFSYQHKWMMLVIWNPCTQEDFGNHLPSKVRFIGKVVFGTQW